jgi:hypothetical protein
MQFFTHSAQQCPNQPSASTNKHSLLRTLQTFVVSKADTTNFVFKKAHITNFSYQKSAPYKLCSLKKRTLQTFLIKKAHPTNFCSLTWEAVGKHM